jgi:CheY-like chemotaxis protein
MVGDRERIMAAGFDGYMTKPIDPTVFVRELERYLTPSAPGLSRPPGHGG